MDDTFKMSTHDPSEPPLVPETLLKKRRDLDELAARRTLTLSNQNKRRRVVRGEDVRIKRPEQFVTEFRIGRGSENKMIRRKKKVEKKKHAIPKSEVKPTIGFMIRIHQGRHASPIIKAELKKLGLSKKYDARFVHLDEKSIAKLKALDAYVTYGYISKKSVEELVHRRAHVKDVPKTASGEAAAIASEALIPLTDNLTVEEALGDKNIICLNDLSHEIFTVGSNYQAATNFLATFSLSAPVGHYEKKVLKINDEVEKLGGFIGDGMETFLNKIL